MMQQLAVVLDTPLLNVVLWILVILLFVLLLIVLGQVARLRKQLRAFMRGSDGASLEESLRRLLEENAQLAQMLSDQQFQINRLTRKLSRYCGNVGIIRYNAFGDLGHDLSFSLAILDEEQNGVVITSIYGREETRMYAKPIEAGTSPYHLSEEELAAIKQASNPKPGASELAGKNRR